MRERTCSQTIVASSLFSIGVLGAVGLFQTGVLMHLPDFNLPHFNADKVHSSAKAYSFFGIPDALLGIASYTVTAGIAGMSERNSSPALPVTLAGKAAIDLANAIRLDLYAWRQLRAWSLPSLLVSAATAVSFGLALPHVLRHR